MDREKIINEYSKKEFMDFLSLDRNGLILTLFNDEGINIIKNSSLKEDRINYILNYSKYKNELLQNPKFLDIFINSNFSYYYASLNKLEFDTYNKILQRCIELNKSSNLISEMFRYFSLSYKLNILNEWTYSKDILYNILTNDEPEVIKKIINNYNINLINKKINLKKFFIKLKNINSQAWAKRNLNEENINEINIPTKMITKELANKLWNNYDIFEIRSIINDASYCTDFSIVNNEIKLKEYNIINDCDQNDMLQPFKKIYEDFKTLKLEENNFKNGASGERYFELKVDLFNNLNKLDFINFDIFYQNNNLIEVENYLKKLSDNCLSNYIIDYLFEENYYNIMLDIRELLNFYYRGNIVIPKERIEIYDKISNIDMLSVNEKKELFDILKSFNIIETFYDDMSLARYIVGESIKEYCLSSETIKQFKDEKLSKQYGVDIYNMKGSYFFGIVKSGIHKLDSLPTGHSYSLIGNNCLATFDDPKNSNTFLYDSNDMNPKQLVHVFPCDSFTYYHPFEYTTNSTKCVNTLLMPDELTDSSKSYNEILLLEKGRNEIGIESSIPELKKIALYCLDEIKKKDVDRAKENNVGIILIDSKNYKKENSHTNIFEHDIFSYKYFDGYNDKNKFEIKR